MNLFISRNKTETFRQCWIVNIIPKIIVKCSAKSTKENHIPTFNETEVCILSLDRLLGDYNIKSVFA